MKQNSIRSFFVKSGPTLKRARVDAGTTDVAVASSDTATAKVIPTLEESASAQDSQLSSEDLTSAVAGDSLFLSLDADWRGILSAELRKPYIHSLEQFVTREYNTCTVYPPKADIFAALNACPLSQIKVVVLGQDPYHGPDQVLHSMSRPNLMLS